MRVKELLRRLQNVSDGNRNVLIYDRNGKLIDSFYVIEEFEEDGSVLLDNALPERGYVR